MAYLTRTDPSRNIDRFYIVDVTPTLFGEWAVLREWGRRGSPGTVRLSSYQRRNEADTARRARSSAGCSTATDKTQNPSAAVGTRSPRLGGFRGWKSKMANHPNRSTQSRYSTKELQERADLLAYIEKAEGDAEWSDLDELKERAALLAQIAKAGD